MKFDKAPQDRPSTRGPVSESALRSSSSSDRAYTVLPRPSPRLGLWGKSVVKCNRQAQIDCLLDSSPEAEFLSYSYEYVDEGTLSAGSAAQTRTAGKNPKAATTIVFQTDQVSLFDRCWERCSFPLVKDCSALDAAM